VWEASFAVPRIYYVYILASASGVLYTGFTNDLLGRVGRHRLKLVPGFTRKYNVVRLVYFERHSDVQEAIGREKEIKAWRRAKRVSLIKSINPEWRDLAADWFPAKLPH
jgi:putative endonuclease